jgi:hypothetical protein
MISLWSNIPFLLYATSGGIALVPFAATALVLRARLYWLLALGLAVAAAVLNVAIHLAHTSDISNNALTRDCFAIAALAFACPIVSAAFTVRQRSVRARVASATAVVAAFVFIAPFFVLVVHCTSGDCL